MSTPQSQAIATRHTGFGLGLRPPHYADFLADKQPLDWLEIITDNFLVQGGKPWVMLDRIRRDYPMAMHGVAMSIGAPGDVDLAYLQQVKALAQRIDPLWVSDHLCWIGPGPEQLHDLYPLPYTDEAARHVIAQIRRVQEVLGRRLVLENVSSYIDYRESIASEWQFLSHIADEADCLLLVDVNNIYVSSVNHGFAPQDYLQALPAHRVQQIHLAGHSDGGTHLVDTHDHPVAPAVWDLYAQACRLFGSVATMIERDDHIPPLPSMLAELDMARGIALGAHPMQHAAEPSLPQPLLSRPLFTEPHGTKLADVQRQVADHVLDRGVAHDLIKGSDDFDPAQRLGVYHHAYRARLSEVLADSFAKTHLFMGSDLFNEHAVAFAAAQPPMTRSLGGYGAAFVDDLRSRYPANPELHELAQLDWDLRDCFDGPDVPALTTELAHSDPDSTWLLRQSPLHPSLRLREITTNVVQLWNAIDADQPVPPADRWAQPCRLMVWRKGLQPHFQTLREDHAQFIKALLQGSSIQGACDALSDRPALQDPSLLAGWLRLWLEEGVLRAG